ACGSAVQKPFGVQKVFRALGHLLEAELTAKDAQCLLATDLTGLVRRLHVVGRFELTRRALALRRGSLLPGLLLAAAQFSRALLDPRLLVALGLRELALAGREDAP